MNPIAVVTTVANHADALRIAHHIVEHGLGACAQISAIDSVYRWDGVVHAEPEFRVLIKTLDVRYAAVEQAILSIHPYQMPAIHAFALAFVEPAYGAWIASESSPAP
jgi:periplasmic divalent cation tolerance protein